MTMPIHINTLEHAKKLTAAGIPQQQAEAHALALGDTLSRSMIVVPDDLTLLRMDILARIDVLKVEFNARIDAVEQSLGARLNVVELKLKSLGWMMVATLAMTAMVLIKLFFLHI